MRTKSSFILEYFIGLVGFSPPTLQHNKFFSRHVGEGGLFCFDGKNFILDNSATDLVLSFTICLHNSFFSFFFLRQQSCYLFLRFLYIYFFFTYIFFLLLFTYFSCIYLSTPFHFLVSYHITSWTKIYVCHICAYT